MGRQCTICSHPEHESIDNDLIAGVSQQEIARRYGVGYQSVNRHKQGHLSPALRAMAAAREAEAAASLVEQARLLVRRADELYEAAVLDGKASTALSALREMRGGLEFLGKATGELDDRPQVTVNLLSSPEILAVINVVYQELADDPERRQRLAGRLQQLQIEAPK